MDEGKARDLAVEIVDAALGHTIEFSHRPEHHSWAYDHATRRIMEETGNERDA